MHRTRFAIRCLVFVLAACGAESDAPLADSSADSGELTFELFPSDVQLTQGGRGTLKVTANRPIGSGDPIILEILGLPEGISATPAFIDSDADSALIQLQV